MNENVKAFLSSSKIVPQIIKNSITKKTNYYDYKKGLEPLEIWENDFSTSIPIYQVYHHVHSFMDDCKIENGVAISNNGKIRKVLFLGYDGMRADAAAQVVSVKNAYNLNEIGAGVKYGGIANVANDGGLYLAYCGGETGTETQQSTSTSAGWTAQFTGVWGIKNGIKENCDTKNMRFKTFALEYAEKGLSTSINFDWTPFFNDNLKPEIIYAANHPQYKIKYINTSLKSANPNSFVEKYTLARETGKMIEDTAARDCTLNRISKGDSIVCGIYDTIDASGHKYEFSPDNTEYMKAITVCDFYTYQILQEIKKREKELNEEWLVILANDHGGKGRGHGGQSLDERTTWIATNIKMNTKMFSKNYNGNTENN